jgi:hypothetical protein
MTLLRYRAWNCVHIATVATLLGVVSASRADLPPATGNPVQPLVLRGVGRALATNPGDFLPVDKPESSGSSRQGPVRGRMHAPWFAAGEVQAKAIALGHAVSRLHPPMHVVVFVPPVADFRLDGSAAQVAALLSHPRSHAFSRQFMGPKPNVRALSTAELARANNFIRANYVAALQRSVVDPLAARWPSANIMIVEGAEPAPGTENSPAWARSIAGPRILLPSGVAATSSRDRLVAAVEAAFLSSQEGEIMPSASRAGEWSWRRSAGGLTLQLAGSAKAARAWRPGSIADRGDGANRLQPDVVVQEIAGGIRVSHRYTNPSPYPREMASLALPTIELGPSAVVQDFRLYGGSVPISSHQAWTGNYPLQLYVPAAVIRNDRVAVGVSLEYPVLSYKHDVGVALKAAGPGAWAGEVSFENAGTFHGSSYLAYSPVLAPGESRFYVVNIVCAPSLQWVETLRPYRNFLHSSYGMASYSRDLRPISGLVLAFGEAQSWTNPRGWAPSIGDPEREGFGKQSAMFEARLCKADRVVAWAPTGLSSQPSMNFPFHFASPLEDAVPGCDASPMLQGGAASLRSIRKQANQSYGLWWGHSASPRRSWNSPDIVSADGESRAEFESLTFRELDAAVRAGATTIGLDAFAHVKVPIWNLVPHLRRMQERHPEVRFCTEGRAPDVLHLVAPTWIDGFQWPKAVSGDGFQTRERFLAADYLIPGHETWVGMQFDRSPDPRLAGPAPDEELRAQYIARTISNGMVPVDWTGADLRSIAQRSQGPISNAQQPGASITRAGVSAWPGGKAALNAMARDNR